MQSPDRGAAAREFAAGWTTVLAAAIAIGVGSMGLGFYSLGLFLQPVQTEFGWSRAAVSGAATFQQLGIFLSAPLVGRLADRFGMRGIAVASYAATALALVLLSRAGPSLAGWYALWLLVSLAGCGTTPAIWARLVSTRFNSARGLALGLMLLGTGFAAMLAPALLGPVFAEQGWRTAVLAMAAVTALVGIPVSLLVTEKRDAAPATPAARGRFERNPQTLILLAVAALLGFIVAGLVVHLVPMLVDRGVNASSAARVATAVGVAVIAARVIVGYLFDRFHAPHVAALFLIAPMIASLILWQGGPAIVAAIFLGLAVGAEVDMLAYFTSRYARMDNYSATYGGILGVFCLGAAFGPLAFGRSVDLSGNYDLALVASAVALAVVVLLIARLGPYRNPRAV